MQKVIRFNKIENSEALKNINEKHRLMKIISERICGWIGYTINNNRYLTTIVKRLV